MNFHSSSPDPRTFQVRRRLGPAGLCCLALCSAVLATPLDGVIEAESGYHDGCEVVATEGSSGEAHLILGDAAELWLEFEILPGQEHHELTLTYRSPGQERSLDVHLDEQDLGHLALPMTHDGGWKTVSLPTGLLDPGFHLLNLTGGPGSEGTQVDSAAICEPETQPECSGCNVAPPAPPIVYFDSEAISLPPVPGTRFAVDLYMAAFGQISIDTAQVTGVRVWYENGECTMQPKDASQPCGEKECKEASGCSMDIEVDFHPLNYFRAPYWNSHEDLILPARPGQKPVTVYYERTGNRRTVRYDDFGVACGSGKNARFQFEHGIVAVPLSCNGCQ